MASNESEGPEETTLASASTAGTDPVLPDPPSTEAESTPSNGPSRRDLQIGGVVVVGLILLVGAFLIGRSAGSSDSSSKKNSGTAQQGDQLSSALALHQAGKLEAAAAGYRAVLASDPNNLYAFYNLGLIAQTNGNYPTALEYYDQALKVDPKFQPAVYNRALVLRDLGRIDDAIVELRKVVAADPKSVGGLYNLGVLLIAQGNAQEGTRLVNEAIELDPSLRNS
jgi:tetratricopeptide (TPR) repeat protein